MKRTLLFYIVFSIIIFADNTFPMEPMDVSPDDHEITLQSNDGHEFTISLSAAQQSQTLNNLIEEVAIDAPIKLRSIDGKTLERIVHILNRLNQMNPADVERLKEFRLSQEQILQQDQLIQSLSYLDVPLVTVLETSTGQILVPLKLALLSPLLAGMVELLGVYNPIPFEHSHAQTMVIITQLLAALEPHLARNESIRHAREQMGSQEHEIYIPRVYQPEANEILAPLNVLQLAVVSDAADFLDLPFVQNACGAAIADRIWKDVKVIADKVKGGYHSSPGWYFLSTIQRLPILENVLSQYGVAIHNTDYILKHLSLRLGLGPWHVSEEYSVADYMSEHAPNEYLQNNSSILKLDDKNLTSLFGIESFANAVNIITLYLNNNAFYNPDLDPQYPSKPFLHFTNLSSLFLQHNMLVALPGDFFDGLAALKNLQLPDNRFTYLPTHIFSPLVSITFTSLNNNRLIDLPNGLFDHNPNIKNLYFDANELSHLNSSLFTPIKHLKELNIRKNYFTEEELRHIKATLPNTEIKNLDQRKLPEEQEKKLK